MSTIDEFLAQQLKENGLIKEESPENNNPNPPANEPPAPPAEPAAPNPVVETPAEPAAPATTFEMNEEHRLTAINQYFGTDFKSLAEAEAIKTGLSERQQLQQKVEELSKVPQVKFYNDKFAELNAFAEATGIDDIAVFRQLKQYQDSAEKDPIDALVLSEILKNPALAEDKENLRELISSKYNLKVDELADDPVAEQKRVNLEKFKIKMDAANATSIIDTTIGKVTEYKAQLPTNNAEQLAQAAEANKSAWVQETATDTFKANFNEVQVEVPLGKDKDGKDLGTETVKLELSAETKQKIAANVEYFINNGLEFSKENVQKLINAQKIVALQENLPAIAQKIHQSAYEKGKQAAELAAHNPSGLKIETPINTGGNEKQDWEKVLAEFRPR